MSQVTVPTSTTFICNCCILCSNAHYYDGNTGSHLFWPNEIRSAWCGSAATVDSEGHNVGFCWPHHCDATTTTSVPDAFSGICQLCHGSSAGEFLFQNWPFHLFLMSYVGVCHGVCFLPSGSHVAAMFTNGGSTFGVCNIAILWSIHLACDGLWPTPGVHWVTASPTVLSRESFILLI